MIFAENTDGIIMMSAVDADRYAGGAYKWQGETRTQAGPSIASISVTGSYTGGHSSGLSPSGHTWTKSLAGKLSFVFDVTTAGDYNLLSLINTNGQGSWVWFELDRRQKVFGPKNQGRIVYNTSVQKWLSGENNTVYLSAGKHTLDVYSLSGSVVLNAIAFAPVGSTDLQANDSADNRPDQVTSGDEPIIDNTTYLEWRRDDTRAQFRVFLLELDHSDGTIYLASLPYSDGAILYREQITNSPSLESGFSETDLGNVELRNPILGIPEIDVDYLNYEFSGHDARWYFGDLDWPKSRFRRIATTQIDDLIEIGDRDYRCSFVSQLEQYNRTFFEGDATTRSETAEQAAAYVMSFAGGAYQFLNVPATTMDTAFSWEISESSNMLTVMETIAASIGAQLRMAQDGYLEIIIADAQSTPAFCLTEPAIPNDQLRIIETIKAVKTVRINYGDDLHVDIDTGASTGALNQRVEIDTYLANEADAIELGNNTAPLYSKDRPVREIGVAGFGDIIQPADFGIIEHPRLTTTGTARLTRRQPLSEISLVELVA